LGTLIHGRVVQGSTVPSFRWWLLREVLEEIATNEAVQAGETIFWTKSGARRR
jgi:hypothetical protein